MKNTAKFVQVLDTASKEEAVLGALLLNPSVADISGILQPDDFANETNRTVYSAILSLHNRGVFPDVVTVAGEIEASGNGGKVPGGMSYLLKLINSAPNSMSLAEYARLLKDASIRRKVAELGLEIINMAQKGSVPASELPAEALRRIEALERKAATDANVVDAAEASLNLLERIEQENVAVPAYFKRLDDATGGFPKGQTVLLAGDTSAGKTALTLQIAEQNALAGRRVLYVSTESPARMLVARRVAGLAGLKISDMRRGLTDAQKDAMNAQIIEYQERYSGKLFFDDRSRTVGEINASVAAVKPELVVVDHLGELEVSDQNRTIGIITNFGGLRQIAQRNDCAMIVIHTQSSDSLDGLGDDDDAIPDLAKVFEWAKGLRYLADMVLVLLSTKTTYGDGRMKRKLWKLKDREGERFVLDQLAFDHVMQWFEELVY